MVSFQCEVCQETFSAIEHEPKIRPAIVLHHRYWRPKLRGVSRPFIAVGADTLDNLGLR